MNQQPPKNLSAGSKPGRWDEIPWPISGHQPHFTMPEAFYNDLVKEFPSVNVDQELLTAYEYMKKRFPGASEAEFCKFILNWMHRNERLNRKVNKWFGGKP